MHSFKFTLWSCFASALAARAVRNITVDDFDPRIVYSNPSVWTHENDGATLDRFNLTTSYTEQKGSASFKFNGTAIYFMSYGLPLPYPDTYQVTLDGQGETRSLRVDNDSQRAHYIAYSRTGLDPSTEHEITISNPLVIPLNIDAFIVTVPDDSTMKDGFAPLSITGTGNASSGSGSGLTTAAKVGIAAGVAGGVLLLGLLVALGVFYQRRQRKSTPRDITSGPVGRIEDGRFSPVQSPEIRSASASVFPYYTGAASSIYTYNGGFKQAGQDGFRKDRRPTGATYRVPEAAWSERDDDSTTISGITSPVPLPSSAGIIAPPPYIG